MHTMHTMHRTRPVFLLIALSALVPVVATGCFLLSRTDPVRYGDTIVENVCHVTYDCCLPSERLAGVGFLAAFLGGADRGRCLEQTRESLGGALVVVQEAIANGTAVYDAELADRCTAEAQAAVDACDLESFVVPGGGGGLQGVFNLSGILFGVDITDPECLAFAGRGFARGQVKDGDDCVASVECADLGACDFGDDDPRPAVGTCVVPAKEGESCEERNCQSGLFCNDDDICEEVTLLKNGDPCTNSGSCESGFCPGATGTCNVDGEECADDFDCDFVFPTCTNGQCNGDGPECIDDFDCDDVDQICELPERSCEDPPGFTLEICNGI